MPVARLGRSAGETPVMGQIPSPGSAYTYRQAGAEPTPMNDTDRIVANFAAAMIGKSPVPNVDDFLAHYNTCLRRMQEGVEAAQHPDDQEGLANWGNLAG